MPLPVWFGLDHWSSSFGLAFPSSSPKDLSGLIWYSFFFANCLSYLVWHSFSFSTGPLRFTLLDLSSLVWHSFSVPLGPFWVGLAFLLLFLFLLVYQRFLIASVPSNFGLSCSYSPPDHFDLVWFYISLATGSGWCNLALRSPLDLWRVLLVRKILTEDVHVSHLYVKVSNLKNTNFTVHHVHSLKRLYLCMYIVHCLLTVPLWFCDWFISNNLNNM